MPEDSSRLTLYGIPNCDQVRRARRWLDARELPYRFHDFRKDGIRADMIERWLARHDWETLVNRRGTTWRDLPTEERCTDSASARRAMAAHPTLIKRPVLECGRTVLVGFDENEYERIAAA